MKYLHQIVAIQTYVPSDERHDDKVNAQLRKLAEVDQIIVCSLQTIAQPGLWVTIIEYMEDLTDAGNPDAG